jgi:hypothetical protein
VVREFADMLLIERSGSLAEVYQVLLDKIVADNTETMEQ